METTEPLLRSQYRKHFTDWLRRAAREQDLTQVEVARRLPFQVHPNTVEKWFQGRDYPRYAEFIGLCVALGELPPVLQGFCPHETP